MPTERSIAVFKPVVSTQEKAAVRVGRLAADLMHEMEQVLKPFDLTATQYNALRIINGAGPDGLCGTDVRERLIAKLPDVPRLLERLEEAGLIARERDPENRRFVRARITPAGVERLIETAPAIAAMHKKQWQHLSEQQLETLIDLLDQARPPKR